MTELDALLPAIQAGDAGAFARWVAGAELRLRLSLTRFASACDTEAVLQETLLRVWQVAPRIEPDGPDALLRFAIRVARNTAVSEVRRLGRVELDDREEAVAPIEPDPLLARVLAFCREKLRGKPALALEARLRSEGARDDAELAQSVDMTLNTFLQNVGRARRALVDCLGRQGVRLEGAS